MKALSEHKDGRQEAATRSPRWSHPAERLPTTRLGCGLRSGKKAEWYEGTQDQPREVVWPSNGVILVGSLGGIGTTGCLTATAKFVTNGSSERSRARLLISPNRPIGIASHRFSTGTFCLGRSYSRYRARSPHNRREEQFRCGEYQPGWLRTVEGASSQPREAGK